MANYSLFVKEKIMSIISDMASRKEEFVKNPGKDFTRNRKLSFEETINFMLSMGGGSLNKELMEHFNYDPNVATSSAFVQQRDKLLTKTFQFLLHEFTHSFENFKVYQGYRLIAVDGSDLLIPHDPSNKQTYFQSTPNSKGFNLLHLNVMYDLCNKVYIDACIQPGRKQNEFKALNDMVDESAFKDDKVIIIADRGYESYNVFAHVHQKGWKFLIRVKDVKSKGITSSLALPETGEFDQQLTRILTRKQTNEVKSRPDIYKFMTKSSNFDYLESVGQLYYPMTFRVVRVKIAEKTYQTFITNLEPGEFRMEQIRELYRMRWGVETSFRELKHTLGLANLHSKKVEYIIQEVFARMVMYNFCEIITLHVVIQQKPRKHGYQVNFSLAMSICRQFFKALEKAHPPDIEALIQKYVLPIRQDRTHPRKIKFRTFVSFNYRLA